MQGGKILVGGSTIESEGNFVQPTIVEISPDADVVKEELFAPVLYVMKFKVIMSFQSLKILYCCQFTCKIPTHSSRDTQCCSMLCLQTLREAIDINNSVPQGLSSSIFTQKPENIFTWIG